MKMGKCEVVGLFSCALLVFMDDSISYFIVAPKDVQLARRVEQNKFSGEN